VDPLPLSHLSFLKADKIAMLKPLKSVTIMPKTVIKFMIRIKWVDVYSSFDCQGL